MTTQSERNVLSMGKVLVTGASGFVGHALCKVLVARGYDVSVAVRSASRTRLLKEVSVALVGDIGPDTEWTGALSGVETIFHLATWTPAADEPAPKNPAKDFLRVNVEGTRRLALSAVAAGVRRFIFASSVMVYGDELWGRSIHDKSLPTPSEPYGRSKLEAERVLAEISSNSGLEITIIRIPLVYGPSARGQLLRLMRVCSRPFLLPFASVHNQHSMIYVGNLVDALILCSDHPKAAGQIFLVRDNEDVSTPQLIASLRKALGRSPLLFSLPECLLRPFGAFVRHHISIAISPDSFVIDDSRIRQVLGWDPPFSLSEALEETATWYKREYVS